MGIPERVQEEAARLEMAEENIARLKDIFIRHENYEEIPDGSLDFLSNCRVDTVYIITGFRNRDRENLPISDDQKFLCWFYQDCSLESQKYLLFIASLLSAGISITKASASANIFFKNKNI